MNSQGGHLAAFPLAKTPAAAEHVSAGADGPVIDWRHVVNTVIYMNIQAVPEQVGDRSCL